jgi:hypothetical protein
VNHDYQLSPAFDASIAGKRNCTARECKRMLHADRSFYPANEGRAVRPFGEG